MISTLLSLTLTASAAGAHPPVPHPQATPAATASDDTRRAAATRLLDASRFRARRQVTVAESVRAAQADLASDCLDQAIAGKPLAECRATATLPPAAAARLKASEPALLDEVMVATQTIYARTFTAAEMDEIARFFRTPVGQKYSAMYPQILREITARQLTIAKRYLIDAARAARRPTGRP